ncbi:MAG TPA: hypothetical protein VHO03_05875 [Ignavibacteriales bacterium]|nr:hypothetical protein [Ignavibacteriales bacterium]
MKFLITHKNLVTNVTGAISGFCLLVLGYLSTYTVEVPASVKVALVFTAAGAVTLAQFLIGKKPEDLNK